VALDQADAGDMVGISAKGAIPDELLIKSSYRNPKGSAMLN
jgi:hypothetical protein